MRKVKRWCFVTTALLVLVIVHVNAGAPFKKVSIAPTQKTTSTTTTAEESSSAASEESSSQSNDTVTEHKHTIHNTTSKAHGKNSKLTGIPQIDYIWDPNLPRELRGYNLSSYPFLATTPPDDEVDFKCDGLHDGFYASIQYKCQVYHHCVYGIRHDFLCANFTAFDQKTFICHFASDVDCDGSKKYWNRNDDLYMATTTTSTTTTTTEPPPTQRRHAIRPQRPLRRPGGRRPIDDYYYDQDDYDEDYYEERLNRRRKQKPRHRKPVVEYDDQYDDEKRSLGDEKPRRPNSRDRIRDDIDTEEDYDYKPKPRNKPTPAAERRKANNRKPGAFVGRSSTDERRSFSDDRPLLGRRKPSAAPVDDAEDDPSEPPRRLPGRRRINDKRSSTTASPASDFDDLDEYERPQSDIPDQEEAAADEDVPPKIKTTPKPLEEFVTPKAASSSVYARPRAPPRIARPVPVNEKTKFKYPVQKTGTTSSPPAAANGDDDYYEDEEYDVRPRGHSRKRIADDLPSEEDDVPPTPRRGLAGRKPTRTLRKPVIEKNPVDEDEEYGGYSRRGNSRRRTPYSGRTRGRGAAHDDVDFVDDDNEERPLRRSKPGGTARKSAKKPRLPEPPSEESDADDVEPEPEIKPTRARGGVLASRRKHLPAVATRSRAPQAASLSSTDSEEPETAEEVALEPETASKPSLPTSRPASVRVVKRPFLPSRGGSPYLPRGLQPVGIAHKESHSTTVSSAIDIYSTMSGSHLLEHGLPLLRDSGPRTTLPPRSPIPQTQPRPEHHHHHEPSSKATLDELYENDYDVTLNDALNPTLKPLSPHQSSHYHQHHDNNSDNNNRPYQQSIVYSPPSAHSVASSSSSALSEPYVHKNQLSATSFSAPSSSPSLSSSDQTVQLPLSQSQSLYHQQQHSLAQQQHHQHQYEQSQANNQNFNHNSNQNNNNNNKENENSNNNNNYNSDSNFSSTDIRRRTIVTAPIPQTSRQGARIAPAYYDEYEY